MSSVTAAGASFAVYSIIIGSEPERSHLYVTVVLETELLCLGSRGVTVAASFVVYSIIIGLEPERLLSYVIVALEP